MGGDVVHVRDLGLPAAVVAILESQGYGELWPSQAEAVPIALAGENLVLAVPTASGKSLVAYLALVQRALAGAKGIYIVPLRALASEKYEDLKAFEPAGLRVAISTGDLDATDPWLSRADIVVCTSEKADALLRHRAEWIDRVGTIVADEVHLVHDPERGPTLEVLLARFRAINPRAQLIALSATIRNSGDVADWLSARHVRSDWRPVALREGVLYGKAVRFVDGEQREIPDIPDREADAVERLVHDSVAGGGQCLVFVNTRKSTESVAEKLRPVVSRLLKTEESTLLSADAAGDVEERSGLDAKVERCVRSGVAFHHAGLTNAQRQRIEKAFKQGVLKAIVATPTLAAGVNLPARRVIVRDLWRYDAGVGNAPIPVLEYKQMAGRAGRPRYDRVGEAICVAKNWDQRVRILEEYLLADPETITSKLGAESALRTHLLAGIAMGFTPDEQAVIEFLQGTFLWREQESWVLEARVADVLRFLREEGFVEPGAKLRATLFGKRTSDLYIDPVTAVKMRDALQAAAGGRRKPSAIGWLHAACATPDMRPLYLRRGDDWIESAAVEHEGELLVPLPVGSDFEWFLSELKTAFLLHDWIDEATMDKIERKYEVYPGDLHQKVDTAEWLVHALKELAHLFHRDGLPELSELHVRVKHGIRRELLPLIRLTGVGRVRARALHAAGFTTLAELRRAPLATLTRVPGVGPGLAASIVKELGRAKDAEDPVHAYGGDRA